VVVLELFAYQPFTFGRERGLLLSLLKMLLGIGRHKQFRIIILDCYRFLVQIAIHEVDQKIHLV
jgi:hypothetical protein